MSRGNYAFTYLLIYLLTHLRWQSSNIITFVTAVVCHCDVFRGLLVHEAARDVVDEGLTQRFCAFYRTSNLQTDTKQGWVIELT